MSGHAYKRAPTRSTARSRQCSIHSPVVGVVGRNERHSLGENRLVVLVEAFAIKINRMANIAIAFKQEISRLARKELRSETESLKKAVAGYRSEIAALKRRMQALEAQQKRTARAIPVKTAIGGEEDATLRFSAKGFAKHRQRLGLSAADYGKLLGVSGLSVYKWEGGKVRPRGSHLPAIAEVRKMGKREAARRLEAAQ